MNSAYEPSVTMIIRILSWIVYARVSTTWSQRQARFMLPRLILAGIISVITNAVDASSATSRVWNVYIDGSGDAPFIQAAVDSAQNGDIVRVGPGSYPEPYVSIIDKTIEVRSSHGPSATTVKHFYTYEAQPDSPDDRVVVSGFTIAGGEEITGGFAILRTGEAIIENCIIRGYAEHSTIETTLRALVEVVYSRTMLGGPPTLGEGHCCFCL